MRERDRVCVRDRERDKESEARTETPLLVWEEVVRCFVCCTAWATLSPPAKYEIKKKEITYDVENKRRSSKQVRKQTTNGRTRKCTQRYANNKGKTVYLCQRAKLVQ